MNGPITLEFLGLLVTVLGGGAGVLLWLMRQFARLGEQIGALKKDVDAQLDGLRKERANEFARMGAKIDALADALNSHKLHVAQSYMSKESFSRVAESITGEIAKMDGKIEARLMRIEDRLEERKSGRGAQQ